MITWYAAYTQVHGETRALEHLQRYGYTAYLPRYRCEVRHARKRSLESRPLFPRYLFVGIDRLTQRWRPVRSIPGVVGLVTSGDEPTPVAPEIIAMLRQREEEGVFDALPSAQRLSAGDAVRVTEGPFADLVGRFAGLSGSDRVCVLLEFLGRAVRTEVSALAVEAA